MKKEVIILVCICTGLLHAQVMDDGWRYRVAASDTVAIRGGHHAGENQVGQPVAVQKKDAADGYCAVLMRYDLTDVPLTNSLEARILFDGVASGEGSNPSFAVYAVENDWDSSTVTFRTAPARIRRITEVTIRPDFRGSITFPVGEYMTRILKDHAASFLIEMRSAPGFSQSVEFSGIPELTLVKAQIPAYDLQSMLRPVWRGSRIENETVLPTAYGTDSAVASFAFVPSKVISVKNYALDKVYDEGTDYIVDGRTIRLPEGSSIPFFRYDELYHNNPNAKPWTMQMTDGGYLTFSESSIFNDKQLAVSYEHADKWTGSVPTSAERELKKTFAKLRSGQRLRLLMFGDSISAGASASGYCSRAPFMPRWADLVAGQLAHCYASPIDYINPSLGGMRSDWGRDAVDGLVSFEKPDLVILGFGMNDNGRLSPGEFAENIQSMMNSIRQQNPDAEFILLMSFQPNSKWRPLEPMVDYLKALYAMEGAGVAVADVWSVHEYLLKHKTYWDMTGNHVNHPNDFLVRIYAQIILTVLGVE